MLARERLERVHSLIIQNIEICSPETKAILVVIFEEVTGVPYRDGFAGPTDNRHQISSKLLGT
jgi:hypothetical protein